jgi:hypothetical protein
MPSLSSDQASADRMAAPNLNGLPIAFQKFEIEIWHSDALRRRQINESL